MTKGNIFTKLQNLQKEIGSVSKDATNPFYKSKYFDINSLIKQLQPLLEKNNLVLLQPIESDYETNTEYVVTKIICPDTEKSIESRKKLSTQSDPQKLGSEITYYRRYTLQSLLALQYNLTLKYNKLTIKIEIHGSKRNIKEHFRNRSNKRQIQEAISNLTN